ncbi:alpha/beta hydrolase [Rhodococcus oxybenzonivorans]|uniref:alpha/beta fold hydrolase n=1 Tax=Rhodococcus oxybenzonivorans TaxID=1990687 RepID=UPI0029549656|nr:alpha/beta hydrolase [Rhodococcus oxybenzonivorans]MDV7353526.1 alpha/beta hydrolase [Rhodococcus oxybenzonivorans]
MAVTFVLLPGAGSDSWYWHRVVPILTSHGHAAITVDLPYSDESAGQYEFADVVVKAFRDVEGPVVLVAQSMSAFTAAIVCERTDVDVDLLVLVAPMLPAPGESAGEWWANTGQSAAQRAFAVSEGRDPAATNDLRELFFHDVPEELIEEAFQAEEVAMSDTPFETVWQAEEWPHVKTRVIAGSRDRLFPVDFMKRIVRERLGIAPDVIDAGHLIALARPRELAAALEGYVEGL